MITNTLAFGPHVEGVIRIEAATAGDADGNSKLVFNGSMEVHSRVHEANDGSERPKHQAHPISKTLMELPANSEAGKLKEIPIRLFFNKAQNALQSRYQAYDMSTGVPVCSGDGVSAVRRERMELSAAASQKIACPGPEVCDFALSGQVTCRRQVTMVLMDTGVIAGSVLCLGDIFLFGTIEHAGDDQMSKVESSGIAFLAETLRAEADISAARLRFFDGAQVNGRFKTLSVEEQQQLGK